MPDRSWPLQLWLCPPPPGPTLPCSHMPSLAFLTTALPRTPAVQTHNTHTFRPPPQIYNRRLDERERRRQFILDRGLLNIKRQQVRGLGGCTTVCCGCMDGSA